MPPNRTFFIVDDDVDDQELFIEAMNEVDGSVTCITSSNCEEALELLESDKIPKPDVIFLDLNMPRLNGKQFLREMKKNPSIRHIPVVIYSTSSEKHDIDETMRLGAAHFLTKPNKFEELCKALRHVATKEWSRGSGTSMAT